MSEDLFSDIPLTTKVSPYGVKVVLDEFFPGARLDKKERLGGCIYTAKIWRYRIEISVSQEGLSEADKTGDATFTFAEEPPKARRIIHKNLKTDDLGVLRKELRKVQEHVLGIAHAIGLACDYDFIPKSAQETRSPPEESGEMEFGDGHE